MAERQRNRFGPFGISLQRLRREGKPDVRIKTLLARLSELDDFGFLAAAEGEASLLDSSAPHLIHSHAVANEVVQRAYASFVLYGLYQITAVQIRRVLAI